MQKLLKLYRPLYEEIKNQKKYLCVIVIVMLLSYSVYAIGTVDTICWMGEEDGLFEYLTALFFFGASLVFFRTYLSRKNLFFLLLSVIFFLGFGEEISWGQRVFHYRTPDFMRRHNVQDEVTIHNIEIFNAHDADHVQKTGFAKLLTTNFQYKLFWLGYCVLLPLAALHIRSIASLARRIRIPIPPVAMGMFFLVNWLIFRITLSFFLPPHEVEQYYDTVGEIRECISAFLFATLGFYFLRIKEAVEGTRNGH